MDIFFQDPTEIPLPPQEVRISSFVAEPYPDGKRVRVKLEITPFQKRPSLEIAITNLDGDEISQANVIETMIRRLEFTMHIRHPDQRNQYSVMATLFYTPPISEENPQLPERNVVHQVQATLTMPTVTD